MRTIYWGNVWCQTDIGYGAWVCAKIRPRWFWTLRRVKFFLSLVWCRYEESRIGWRLAWSISKGDAEFTGPMKVRTWRDLPEWMTR